MPHCQGTIYGGKPGASFQTPLMIMDVIGIHNDMRENALNSCTSFVQKPGFHSPKCVIFSPNSKQNPFLQEIRDAAIMSFGLVS